MKIKWSEERVFILKQTLFRANDGYAIAWDTLTYELVQCGSFNW
jgi:hypothetical protein